LGVRRHKTPSADRRATAARDRDLFSRLNLIPPAKIKIGVEKLIIGSESSDLTPVLP